MIAGYIGEFEEVDDHRSGKVVIQLNGRLNKTGVISPRYNVQLRDLEKWVVKLLPSRQFGYIVLTTSAGIMDHEGSKTQARCRQDHWFLLLGMNFCTNDGMDEGGLDTPKALSRILNPKHRKGYS